MTLLIAIALTPLALITTYFSIEVIVGLAPLHFSKSRPSQRSGNHSAVIIIPAHDEEAIISDTLEQLRTAADGQARILVVADNCMDATAEKARACGVEVIERTAPEQRGKGFALAFARSHLQSCPPAVVAICDADCTIDAASIAMLIDGVLVHGRPCQAVNLLTPQPDASPLIQLSTFAFLIKNLVRQRALQRLAGRVHLTGTGMAFPWPIFAHYDLATDSIVEDLKLGIEAAVSGHPPRLVPEATIWSDPAPERAALGQRRRWEGGYLATAARMAPAALWSAIVRADVRGFCAALNLFVPPVALLMLVNLVLLALALAVTWTTGAQWWPAVALGLSVLAAGLALMAAWWSEGRGFLPLGALARTPLYLLWKLPIYAGFALRGAPREWLRTGR